MATAVRVRYSAPSGGSLPPKYLAADAGTAQEQRFVFFDTLEIGRDQSGRADAPGELLVEHSMASFRHCVITQHAGGRCTIRDTSLNGTTLDGHPLERDVETEILPGQVIEVVPGFSLVLQGQQPPAGEQPEVPRAAAVPSAFMVATVLVGDIRDFASMVNQAPPLDVQRSVSQVFERLTAEVTRLRGAVRESRSGAIFAYWEGPADGKQAMMACHAALTLNAFAARLASDRSVWNVPGYGLGMDWALATGPVIVDTSGGAYQRAGLPMVGEAVVRAFRLEKFATPDTGPILTCETTYQMAMGYFAFRSLGVMQAAGSDRRDRVYALVGPKHAGGPRP